jgi:Mg-chelatase subunit ChlD
MSIVPQANLSMPSTSAADSTARFARRSEGEKGNRGEFIPQAQSVGVATEGVPLTASAPRVIALEDSVDRSYRARGSQIALPALAAAGGEQEVMRKTMADRSAGTTANFFSSMQNDGPIVSGNSLALNEGIADKPMGAPGRNGSASGGGVGSGVAVGQTHWGFGTQNGRRGGELANAPQRNQTGAWTVAPENDFVALPQGQVTQLGLADSRKLAEENKPREMERLARTEPAVAGGDMFFGGKLVQPSEPSAREYAAMGRTERPAVDAYDVEAKPGISGSVEAKRRSAPEPTMTGKYVALDEGRLKALADHESFGLAPAQPAAARPMAGPAPVAVGDKVDAWSKAQEADRPEARAKEKAPVANQTVNRLVTGGLTVDLNGGARLDQKNEVKGQSQLRADASGVTLNYAAAPEMPMPAKPDRAQVASSLGDAQKNVWFDSPTPTPVPAGLPQSKESELRLKLNRGITLADMDGDGPKMANQSQDGFKRQNEFKKQDGFNLDVVDLQVESKAPAPGVVLDSQPKKSYSIQDNAMRLGEVSQKAESFEYRKQPLSEIQRDEVAALAKAKLSTLRRENEDVLAEGLKREGNGSSPSPAGTVSAPAPVVAMDLVSDGTVALKTDALTLPTTPSSGSVDASAKGKKPEVSVMVQDAKLLYELRKTDEAEAKLKEAIKQDPANAAAKYYQGLVEESRFGDAARKRDYEQRSKIVEVEKAWEIPVKPTPNPYARTNTTVTASTGSDDGKLVTRKFAVDPKTLATALGDLTSMDQSSTGNTGGGRGGGGGIALPRVSMAENSGGGISGVTRQVLDEKVQEQTRQLFAAAGVNLGTNGTQVYFNDRTGVLLVRGTERDMELVQQAIEVLAIKPPEVQVQAKFAEVEQEKLAKLNANVKQVAKDEPVPQRPPSAPAGIPQPEISTAQNAFSTFSLNVSDVSFKLTAASLEKGLMPEPATVRTEEFINAFNYHDPEPTGNARVAFAWERARYPFAHDRDLVRFAVKTGAVGREPGKPLNIVLLLDNSGSMERADRVQIRRECLRVLGGQLQPQDKVSVVAFARTARLWVDGLAGAQARELPSLVGNLTPEGGTNLEEAMSLAYATAQKHFVPNGVNRVVLLTDGAANLGDVSPDSLKKKVVSYRQQGVALDCFGIGWEGYNDDLLEALSRNGDGRYGFVNSPEAATTEFASQLAGALQVAASDVKVQVEWNPKRVTVFRQLGYAKHQLKKEEFRDNKVDAAEIGAAEAGNALYTAQVNPAGEGPLGVVRVRYRVPNTNDYREHEWTLAYDGASKPMELSSVPLRLAATASAFSEWLVASPFAGEVTAEGLITQLNGVPEAYPADPRPKQLEWMIRQAKSLSGR